MAPDGEGAQPLPAGGETGMAGELLRVCGASVAFGGLKAVDSVDLSLREREIRAIIGPNGAGKTTLASLLSGRLRPAAGRILFRGRDITRLPGWRRVRLGIAHTFQITSVHGALSVLENVTIAAGRGRWWPDRQEQEIVTDCLGRTGLLALGARRADTLSHGHQRLLEVAVGLALRPGLLIMDEPTQGLPDGETDRLCTIIRGIAAEATVLLIEHNVPAVMSLADRITVMNQGRILAEGPPGEIRNSSAVQEVYLGHGARAAGERPAVAAPPEHRVATARPRTDGRDGQARMALELDRLAVFRGNSPVLREFSLTLARGEVLCLLGRNGAGKTTVLRTIMGALPVRSGRIRLDGTDITGLAADRIPRHGIAHVPQGRRLFAELTVRGNLEIGLMARRDGHGRDGQVLEQVLALFPPLRERLDQPAGTLSGGEQQMASIGRALCAGPLVLLLDEPTEGLMPPMVALVRDIVCRLRGQAVTILVAEQRTDAVIPVADRVAFVENGRVAGILPAAGIGTHPELLRKYAGVD